MVKEEKLKQVEELKEDLEKSPVIVFIDMYKMPSKQLQEIRKKLRGKAKIKMMKKSILMFAIGGVKKEGVKELEAHTPTQPAIALTEMAAFKFYAFADRLRFKTFAKEGDVATEDIWVSAGPTDLMAGPAISELQQAGVPASIESGRIKIRKDVCVVKKGEEIPAIKVGVLRKLKVEPMEVTLNIVAIYDNGDIYTKDALEITKTFPDMLAAAFRNALNLSVFIAFPTKENIKQLIAKAARTANAIREMVGGAGEKKEEAPTEELPEPTTEEPKEDSTDNKTVDEPKIETETETEKEIETEPEVEKTEEQNGGAS
jgi:large subunit ribosomal protein L10